MPTPNAAEKVSQQADLEDELHQAEQEFAEGDFVDVTVAQLDRCLNTEQWPWANESCD